MRYTTALVLAVLFSAFSCGGSAHAAGGYDIQMKCLESQGPVTTVRVEPGWSQSTGTECVHVSAHNAVGGLVSVVVVRGYPEDCVPVPEPPTPVVISAGVAALLWRRRA